MSYLAGPPDRPGSALSAGDVVAASKKARRRRCCCGKCLQPSGEDTAVIFVLVGVTLLSLAYYYFKSTNYIIVQTKYVETHLNRDEIESNLSVPVIQLSIKIYLLFIPSYPEWTYQCVPTLDGTSKACLRILLEDMPKSNRCIQCFDILTLTDYKSLKIKL